MTTRQAWLVVNVYKSTYLILIVANLALMYARWGFDHEPYAVAVAFLIFNFVSWLALLWDVAWGYYSERILSVGRMIGILMCATLFFADLVAWMSPVSESVWVPLLELSAGNDPWTWRNRLMWWIGCAVLLGLENIYFYCLTRVIAASGTTTTQTTM